MKIRGPQRIVLLGIMSRMPVGGLVWATLQYLIGFQRLGYDVYYVEAHGSTPRMFMRQKGDDGWQRAAAFVAAVMQRFDLQHRWAYHVVHDDRCFGMSREALRQLYASADFIVNLHGSTKLMPEHSAAGELIYVDTDPVDVQIEIHENAQHTIDLLAAHSAFVTWGLNYGNPDSKVPVSNRFVFHPTPPPVVMDFWDQPCGMPDVFTTIGNWRQEYRAFAFQGETYYWSKHHEFLKFVDVPVRTGGRFELALSSYEPEDRVMLEEHGWRVRDALSFSTDLDAYRAYIQQSRGEFTVAKDQNIRLRSGWFSERSATYLAAGRPVITQETGFSNVLPTGEGLFAFSTLDDVAAAVDRIATNYSRHSRAARTIAVESFDYRVVLPQLLAQVKAA